MAVVRKGEGPVFKDALYKTWNVLAALSYGMPVPGVHEASGHVVPPARSHHFVRVSKVVSNRT